MSSKISFSGESSPGVVRFIGMESAAVKLPRSIKEPADYWKEALAIAHLRAWISDRRKLSDGHVWMNRGRPKKGGGNPLGNARLVRCIDFEGILALLPAEYAAVLVLWYRDHLSASDISICLACSVDDVLRMVRRAKTALYQRLEERQIL
jgi:hypothetical protein